MIDRIQPIAWRIPVLYALIAGAWIFLSDRLLDALVSDPLRVGQLQTAKGWAFAAITAGLLYALLRRETQRGQRAEAALRESEQRYRRIVETTEEGIWMIDADNQTTFVNQKMADVLGYSVPEMIGMPVLTFMDAEGQAIARAALERRRQGIREQFEAKFRRRDGTALWALLAASPVEDDAGRYAGALAMVTDITTRKRAEEQLAQLLAREQAARVEIEAARERLASVFEAITDAFVALDTDWRYTYVNKRAGDIFGRRPEDLIGKHIWTEFPEGIGQPFYYAYYRAVEEQVPIQLEEYYPPYERWFENRIFPSKEGLSIFFQDNTERKRAEVALHASEQQLSLIFDTVGDVIFLLAVEPDDCFRFIAMNRAGLDVTGLTQEQVIGKRVEEVLPETAHALVIGKYKEAIRENQTVSWEEISAYPSGTLYGEVAVTPIRDSAGNCTHLIGSVHDITGIRRAEATQRKYTERLSILHEIDQAILAARSPVEIAEAALGRVQQLVSCQQTSLTIIDDETEELVVIAMYVDGETVVERGARFPLQGLEIPDQLRQGAAHVIDDISTLPMLPLLLRALRAEGLRALMAVPLLLQGELIGTLNLAAQARGAFQPEDIAIAREVADQLAVAIRGAQLHEAEQHARRITDTLHAANEALTRTLDLNSVLETLLDHLGQLVPFDSANVMLLTPDARLAVHTLRGYERWTDPAKTRAIIFDPSATPVLQTILTTRQSLLIPNTTIYPGWQRPAGGEHVRSWFGVPLLANDKVIGIYSVDKTLAGFFAEEHVRLAEALAAQAAIAIQNARLHAQIQHHAAELELRVAQRTAQLEAANKELEAFSYSVSHDLRAPLRAVSGFAEIIARRHAAGLNDEGRHYVDNIVQASARMGQLINDLLAYARLGRISVRRRSVSLHDLLAQVTKDLAARVAASGAAVDLPDNLPAVCGDPTLLHQIFANLLDNALTYQRPGTLPEVTIGWQDESDHVIVSVSDNGIGVPPEHYDKIFKVFQRLHSEDEYPGTGIGLAIVKKSAELLGGRVWVESVVGAGSTFSVRLPKE